jgi:hypothetical protein
MKPKIFPFIVFIVVGVGVFWLGSGIFAYFTHNKNSDFVLEGIQDQGAYKGNLSCSILSNNEYKVAMVSSQLDGKEIELPSDGKVRAKQFSTSFFIDTTTFMVQGLQEFPLTFLLFDNTCR